MTRASWTQTVWLLPMMSCEVVVKSCASVDCTSQHHLLMTPLLLLLMLAHSSSTTYTHTHPFNGPFPGLPRFPGTRKVKPIWILKARDSEWQWHQLGHMQVCTSLRTDNHASIPPFSFLQAGCPSCHPANSVKALKAQSTTYTHTHTPV